MGEGDTLFNATIGAVVTVVLSAAVDFLFLDGAFVGDLYAGTGATVNLSFAVIPAVLGGAVAGNLQKGTRSDGIRAGALSAAIAAIPLLFLFVVISSSLPQGPVLGFGFVLAVGLVLGAVISAFGGYLGVSLATDADIHI